MTPIGREAITRWMRRWLLDVDDAVTDQEFKVWSVADLQCTPRGEVLLLDDERSVYDLNAERAAQLASQRKPLDQLQASDARALVRKVAGIRSLADLPEPAVRQAGTLNREGDRINKLIFEPAPGLTLPALEFVPEKPSGPRVLYLSGSGCQQAAAVGGELDRLAQQNRHLLAVDLRGLGATRGKSANQLLGNWKDFYLAYLLGQSLVGLQAEDVLATGRWLTRRGDADQSAEVMLVADGDAAIASLHAVAVEPSLFKKAQIRDLVERWDAVARTQHPVNQLTGTIHGMLRHYDLLDLAKLAGSDKVSLERQRRPDGTLAAGNATGK